MGQTDQWTLVLPSGVSKVTTVSTGSTENCRQLQLSGGIGINGNVDPNQDYAYTSMASCAVAMAYRFPDDRNNNLLKILDGDKEQYNWWSVRGPYAVSERLDGSCVVIDFRTFPNYMEHTNAMNYAVVKDCSNLKE